MIIQLFSILYLSAIFTKAHRTPHFKKVVTAKETYGSYRHQTLTPRITDDEYNNLQWSSEVSSRKNARGQHVLHNYTVFVDDNGNQRSRWLKREFFPKTITKRYGSMDRGDRSWEHTPNNQARNPGCPVVILMCYFDGVARDALRDLVNEGMKRWHDGLGEGRGVRFAITKSVLCFKKYDVLGGEKYEPNPDFGPHVVIIKENIGGIMHSSLGYNPTIIPAELGLDDWNYLDFDELSWADEHNKPTEKTIRAMVHELGHTLGLFHEHQRKDAAQYVTLYCEAIDNYHDVAAWLNSFPFEHPYQKGHEVTMDDVCNDYVIAQMILVAAKGKMDIHPPPTPPPPFFIVEAFVPATFIQGQPSVGPSGFDIAPLRDMVVSDGVFDWDSVMLYPGKFGNKILMTRKGVRGAPELWPVGPSKPSRGDVEAVERLYPRLF
ncbi:hypothetical protein Vi05172_g3419 [Venturia inaequalis]|nr:hypothetical protein Vi05172_g3419 [Venturia inaequalis]